MACDVAREACTLLGANGILVEYAAMRHMANVESVYTSEGDARCAWAHTRAGSDRIVGLLRSGLRLRNLFPKGELLGHTD